MTSSPIAKLMSDLNNLDSSATLIGGPASSKIGEGVAELLSMLLDIKNQLNKIEKKLAAPSRTKVAKKK